MIQFFKNLYEYRELLKTNIKKEIRGKYKGAFLGILWSFINPLLQVLVYAIVFPFIMKNREPNYITFLICGIIPWNYFTSNINQGSKSIIDNGAILKKVYFPREILPISSCTAGLVNFFIQSSIIIIFLLFSGIGYSKYFFLFPLIAIVQYFFALGIIFITSCLEVYMRDLEYIINFFLSLAFYVTPVLYSASAMENTPMMKLFKVNPVAILIMSYRDVFIYQRKPDFLLLGIVLLASILFCFIGMSIFRKLEKGFAEEF